MKNYISLLLLLLVNISYGQTAIKKSSISTEGGTATAGTVKIVYAIGEVAIQENTQGTVHISEGFVGPDLAISLGVATFTALEGITVYPNPTIDNVTLAFTTAGNYKIELYDLTGKHIGSYATTSSNFTINVAHLSKATYMLLVKNKNTKQFKSYKIIKK